MDEFDWFLEYLKLCSNTKDCGRSDKMGNFSLMMSR